MSGVRPSAASFLEDLSPAALSLWAKSGSDRSRAEGEDVWLCLPQHMLDAAGAAEYVWDEWAPLAVRDSVARETGLSVEDARTLLSWLAAVHDVGKAILTFQGQLEARDGYGHFLDRLRAAGLPVRPVPLERTVGRLHHSLASMMLVRDWLTAQGIRRTHATRLAAVLDAHHGSPSLAENRGSAEAVLATYAGAWADVHHELLEFAADISGIHSVLPSMRTKLRASGQMLLTGLVIMADWIASSEDAFPLTTRGYSGERSAECLQKIDLTAPWVPHPPDSDSSEVLDEHLRQRFSLPDSAKARPVQVAAAAASRKLAGSGLVVIEAPTGEGKTEAALTAAEILAEKCGSGGLIFAAPTMSTADGLFHRVLDWTANTSAGAVTSMFLAHSKSRLNSEYRRLRSTGIGLDEPDRAEGAVVASQWMSGRKKGVLSNMSVATVDQILFLALQAKHSMLRHLGLAGKVVVIDEVHAYDAYMSEYLATALAWLARYRVPVVLLSATLPGEQKRALLAAYGSEVADVEVGELSSAYPLVTSISGNGLHELPVEARPADLHARVEVEEDALERLTELLQEETSSGGCVLVICNTVRRAQDAYRSLRESFPEQVELHHAAFLASERVAKETALRESLGPRARVGSGRPERRIVVATQVAEQSLDIDVDLLITDIAPVDLLIQRIGRLHRHARPASDRPDRLREPRVLIRAVTTLDPPEFDPGAEAVYGRKLLLSTLAVLLDGVLERGFIRPDDIAPLVQTAYGQSPPIPSAWSESWDEAVAIHDALRDTQRSRSTAYRLRDPRAAASLDDLFRIGRDSIDTSDGEERGLAQVRDSDPTVEVIPILAGESGYGPFDQGAMAGVSPDREPPPRLALDLACSTVRLPARFTRFERDFEETLDTLEARTPPGWQASTWLKGQVALPLDEEGGIDLIGRRLVYDRELGLHDVTDARDRSQTVNRQTHRGHSEQSTCR